MAKANKKANRLDPAFDAPPVLPTKELQNFHEYRPTSIKVDGNKQPRAIIRRVVMYQRLFEEGKITDRQHRAAHHYRNNYDMTEHSETKSCLDVRIRGTRTDHDISAKLLDAQRVVADGLRCIGSLYDVFTLIIESDMTLHGAAAKLHGTRDTVRKGKPSVELKHGSLDRILLELQFALERLASTYDL